MAKWSPQPKKGVQKGQSGCEERVEEESCSLYELLTCLAHASPMCRKRPIMSLLLGYSLGLFILRQEQLNCLESLEVAMTVASGAAQEREIILEASEFSYYYPRENQHIPFKNDG